MKLLAWLILALPPIAVSLVRPATAADTAGDSTTTENSAATDNAAKTDNAAPAETSDQKSESDARRALGRWFRFPWYDSASDDIKPVHVRVRKPIKMPETSIFQIFAWVVIAVLLAGLVWLIFMALLNYHGVAARETSGPRVATRLDHVEALPFMRQRSLDDLLGQARQHYLAGNYDEAIIYLFSYQLVELDRRNLIRLAVGKTNRQYLRELRGRGTLAGLLEHTMVAFEDVYFGGRRLTRQRFDSAWNRLPEFESLLASFGPDSPALPVASVEPVALLAESVAGRD